MEMLIIGKITKPHGIRGSLKALSFLDSPYAFSGIKTIILEDKSYIIEKVSASPTTLIIKLQGLDTIEDAERFRDKEIFIQKEKLPKPPKDRYYIDDLIGCKVFRKEKELGTLVDIMQNGSADIYCIEGEKNIMFPYVGNVIEKIDISQKEIIVNEKEFKKVAVYED